MTVARSSLLASAIAMTMLAGCGGNKGPTAAEAAQTLKVDITMVLNGINARNISVVDDGSRDHPCGKEKAQRSYVVSATRHVPGLDDPSGLVNEMTGNLVNHYEVVNPKFGPGIAPSSELRNKKERTNIIVSAPSRGQVRIAGSTDCLRMK